MSELDRIIGRLEHGFDSLNARLKKIEKKLDKLDSDYHERRGVSKFALLVFSMLGGALTHLLSKVFDV